MQIQLPGVSCYTYPPRRAPTQEQNEKACSVGGWICPMSGSSSWGFVQSCTFLMITTIRAGCYVLKWVVCIRVVSVGKGKLLKCLLPPPPLLCTRLAQCLKGQIFKGHSHTLLLAHVAPLPADSAQAKQQQEVLMAVGTKYPYVLVWNNIRAVSTTVWIV